MLVRYRIVSFPEQPLCCMCCRHWCSLHHICANQINNDKVHQSTEIVVGNKNIHSLSNVVRKKVKDLFLNMCFVFQNNNYNNISKCVVGCYTLIPIRAPKQTGT